MNLQEKYDLLMEKIADKTEDVGCLGIVFRQGHHPYVDVIYIGNEECRAIDGIKVYSTRDVETVIGHPITIGRCMQFGYDNYLSRIGGFHKTLFQIRPSDKFDKHIQPTEDFEKVIDFLFGLL